MFGLSGEHILLLFVVLLIFGPKKLPDIGRAMGRAVRGFRDSFSGVQEAQFTKVEEEKPEEQKSEKAKEDPKS